MVVVEADAVGLHNQPKVGHNFEESSFGTSFVGIVFDYYQHLTYRKREIDFVVDTIHYYILQERSIIHYENNKKIIFKKKQTVMLIVV